MNEVLVKQSTPEEKKTIEPKSKPIQKPKQATEVKKPKVSKQPRQVEEILKGTLDKGDVVEDMKLRKKVVVQKVKGSQYEGIEATGKKESVAPIKVTAKESKPSKSQKVKELPFKTGDVVKNGKSIYLVTNLKSDTLTLEEIDGRQSKVKSVKLLRPVPNSILDDAIKDQTLKIVDLEKKIQKESEALRQLYKISKETLKSLAGKTQEAKFRQIQNLKYQRSVLLAIHKKDMRALKLIAKRSDIDFESLTN
ncbi:hypothetical protein U1Q18_050168 [Sarracenia purpurea var. burkii]